jgi:hypothetical protein
LAFALLHLRVNAEDRFRIGLKAVIWLFFSDDCLEPEAEAANSYFARTKAAASRLMPEW